MHAATRGRGREATASASAYLDVAVPPYARPGRSIRAEPIRPGPAPDPLSGYITQPSARATTSSLSLRVINAGLPQAPRGPLARADALSLAASRSSRPGTEGVHARGRVANRQDMLNQ